MAVFNFAKTRIREPRTTMKINIFFLVLSFVVVVDLSYSLPAKDDRSMHAHTPYNPTRRFRRAVFSSEESTPDYWYDKAQQSLLNQLQRREIKTKAKNVIMFLGDGMSIPTLAAARAYQGQLQGVSGEGSKLEFERFPFTGLSKTYCVDRQVADSACTATAYLCGSKANYGTIGVSPAVSRDSCPGSQNTSNHIYSIARWAQLAGKSTGVVTTTRVTHASPAGVYAHTAERDWEADSDLEGHQCEDIASQLVGGKTGQRLNVVLGGGRRKFLPTEVVDDEGTRGDRGDSRNLINEWLAQHTTRAQRAQYVWNREQLLQVSSDTDYLLGLFESDHCQYHLDADPEKEPSLEEMTTAAIKILSRNSDGYFLFVEGGRIDHAHHDTKAHKALDETIEFSKAIRAAKKLTNIADTLIVVTSDHAHTMSMAGYPERGNDIFGIAGMSKMDKKPYSTLSYANGPGYKVDEEGGRHDISKDNMKDIDYEFPAVAPLDSETHGGDDVAIFASGPWAHLFSGVLEQNIIPHVMAYAACIGNGATTCGDKGVYRFNQKGESNLP